MIILWFVNSVEKCWFVHLKGRLFSNQYQKNCEDKKVSRGNIDFFFIFEMLGSSFFFMTVFLIFSWNLLFLQNFREIVSFPFFFVKFFLEIQVRLVKGFLGHVGLWGIWRNSGTENYLGLPFDKNKIFNIFSS